MIYGLSRCRRIIASRATIMVECGVGTSSSSSGKLHEYDYECVGEIIGEKILDQVLDSTM
jgi:hypothetical protein